MDTVYQKIGAYIGAHEQEMCALWEKLVNMDTHSFDKAGTDRLGALLAKEMEHAGMQVRVAAQERAGDILIGEWNSESGAAPVALLGHMDTVFPAPAASRRPFRIDADKTAHGPGVLDMKGGLVIALYAVKALRDCGFRACPVKCIFVTDEENLHRFSDAAAIVKRELRGCRAAFNLESGSMDDSLVIGRSGGGIFTLRVQGIAGHAGLASKESLSAIVEAARIVEKLEACNDPANGLLMNCGTIEGGVGENIIPGECTIRGGIRFCSSEAKAALLRALEAAAESPRDPRANVTLTIECMMDCMETTPEIEALYRSVAQSALRCGYGLVRAKTVSGVSDASLATGAGIPAVCALGVKGGCAHTTEEYAVVASLYSRCRLVAASIFDLAVTARKHQFHTEE